MKYSTISNHNEKLWSIGQQSASKQSTYPGGPLAAPLADTFLGESLPCTILTWLALQTRSTSACRFCVVSMRSLWSVIKPSSSSMLSGNGSDSKAAKIILIIISRNNQVKIRYNEVNIKQINLILIRWRTRQRLNIETH